MLSNPPDEILVIEKHATFTRFCKRQIQGQVIQNVDEKALEEARKGNGNDNEIFHQHQQQNQRHRMTTPTNNNPITKKQIIITGKGFPDRLTKVFLYHLTQQFPTVTIKAFVDSDVYGLAIFKEYWFVKGIYNQDYNNYGSSTAATGATKKMTMTTAEPSCSRLQFAGVKLFDLSEDDDQDERGISTRAKYLRINNRDRVRMRNMLKECSYQGDNNDGVDENENDQDNWRKIKRELQLGLFFHVKKEMDG
ncbi:unnamed protein product [Ambrosiozyma monospora]|uniref:Unnamed protein product n=1 Tax=Ambrosiozyma monospora TaxID=43982 RepID=A0ACB5T9H7_AMBMO|nr:unnamed protein product [Ambrosiozyma monospora]